MDGRYSRQIAFSKIGDGGQQKLCASRVAIVGLGALGTAAADRLCRAGIGFLRLIDPDRAELSNLQRQTLYAEADIGAHKTAAAASRLRAINPEIALDTKTCLLDASNAEELLAGCDIVLDCTDNSAARYVINDACHLSRITWIHCAAAGSAGTVFAVMPDGPCFRCLYPNTGIIGENAGTIGMLGTITGIVGALGANEAIRLLVGEKPLGLMMFNIWYGTFETIPVMRNPDCPVCGGEK